MEEVLNSINEEIERLTREDIEPAEHNSTTLDDNRIRDMAERFRTYRYVLKAARDENSINRIIEYANKLFSRIDWESSETTDVDNRIDSLKILVYIMNLLTTNDNKSSYLKLEHSNSNAQRIINIINIRKTDETIDPTEMACISNI